MKIEELNKENALSVENNLELKNEYFDPQKWIVSYMEFDFEEIIKNETFKIYQSAKYRDTYVVTDLEDNVLRWFAVYDYLSRYETKFEYLIVGHERNYHIDKENGELNSYEW